jgi:hypothetical protein
MSPRANRDILFAFLRSPDARAPGLIPLFIECGLSVERNKELRHHV